MPTYQSWISEILSTSALGSLRRTVVRPFEIVHRMFLENIWLLLLSLRSHHRLFQVPIIAKSHICLTSFKIEGFLRPNESRLELDGMLIWETKKSFQNYAITKIPQVAFSLRDTNEEDLQTHVCLPFVVLATWDKKFWPVLWFKGNVGEQAGVIYMSCLSIGLFSVEICCKIVCTDILLLNTCENTCYPQNNCFFFFDQKQLFCSFLSCGTSVLSPVLLCVKLFYFLGQRGVWAIKFSFFQAAHYTSLSP